MEITSKSLGVTPLIPGDTGLVALDCSISWTRKNMSYSFLQLMLEGMHTSNELKITTKCSRTVAY